MNYGFENGKWFVEHTSCTRTPGTLREEAENRVQDLYNENKKLILCTSSGLDSQVALHSFKTQDIPVECAFMHLNGYNEYELDNILVLEKKYGYKTNVITIDPDKLKDEVLALGSQLDVNPHHILHYKFVEQLPSDYNIVQALHDPWFVTKRSSNTHYVFNSFYDPEFARHYALTQVPRIGNIKMFCESAEFRLASVKDTLIDNFFDSYSYYDDATVLRRGKPIHDVYRYERYVKAMMYAKYWGKELEYFSKFAGYENIFWLDQLSDNYKKQHMVFIERNEFINFLSAGTGESKKFFESNWNELT